MAGGLRPWLLALDVSRGRQSPMRPQSSRRGGPSPSLNEDSVTADVVVPRRAEVSSELYVDDVTGSEAIRGEQLPEPTLGAPTTALRKAVTLELLMNALEVRLFG
jgi:hypothetical protein